MDPSQIIEFQQAQIESLHREKTAALQALDLAASMGAFSTAYTHLADHEAILRELCVRSNRMITFRAASVYLVDENTNDVYQAFCDAPELSASIEAEVSGLIADQTFAFALQTNGPLFFLTADRQASLLLHVIGTSARTRGMFVGIVGQRREDIPDTAMKLFTVVMLAAAHALEGFEAHRLIVAYRNELEQEVRARTQELNTANARLTTALNTLRRNESKYRSIFNNSAAGIYLCDGGARYVDCNEKFASMLGYDSISECLSLVRDIDTQVYVDSGRREELLRQLREKGYVESFESEVYGRDGDIIHIEEHCRAEFSLDESVMWYESVVLDITERKLAEQDSAMSLKILQRTIDTTPDAIALIDLEYTILLVNDGFKSLLSGAFKNTLGMNINDVLPEALRIRADVLKRMADGESDTHWFSGKEKDCEYVMRLTPFVDDHRAVIGAVYTVSKELIAG